MKASIAHACSRYLLRLYPQAWRERYADEITAVLEARPITLRTLFDLLLGMLDAQRNKHLLMQEKDLMLKKTVHSQITIFCSVILVIFLWAFYDTLSIDYPGIGNLWELPGWYYPNGRADHSLIALITSMTGFCLTAIGLIGLITLLQTTARRAIVQKKIPFLVLLGSWLLSLFVVAFLVIRFTLPLMPAHNIFLLPRAAAGELLLIISTRSLLFSYNPMGLLALFWGLLSLWAICIGPICLLLEARHAEHSPRITRLLRSLTTIATVVMTILLICIFTQVALADLPFAGSGLLRVPAANLLMLAIALPTVISLISLRNSLQTQPVMS